MSEVVVYKHGSNISEMMEEVYKGNTIDVRCGPAPTQKWINSLADGVSARMMDKYSKKIVIKTLYPSPDNPTLVRFMGQITSNKDAVSLLKKEL